MKRSSSLNDCDKEEATPKNNASSEHANQISSSAPALQSSQQHHRHQQQQQRQFHQWASMSIDRTRMRPHQRQQEGGVVQLTQNGGRTNKSSENNNNKKPTANHHHDTRQSITSPVQALSPVEGGRGNNHSSKPLDPCVYFMSDVSEEDMTSSEVGSSHADFQKKLLYRQKLREFDALSAGDTSLSSSNISPTPQRFRVQFENSINNSSDQIKNNIGKMRNKIKAASARLSLSSMSMMQSESSEKVMNGGDANNGNYRRKVRSPLDGRANDDLLQAALMPPTGSSREGGSGAGASDARGPFNCNGHQMLSPYTLPLPPLPHLDGTPYDDQIILGEESQSSADSVRGISITTEQSGGEDTSSSALQSCDTNGYSSPNMPMNGPSRSPPKQLSPERTRRKVSPHRRMRSGDAVAATLMNFGREDWIGMNLDNIPIPEGPTDDDDGSSAFLSRKENQSSYSNESSPLFAYGNTSTNSIQGRSSTWDGSRDGYSAGSSAVTSHRNPPTTVQNNNAVLEQHPPQQFIPRNNSTVSGDTFDFSDSGGGGGSVTRSSIPHSSSFDPAMASSSRPIWDGGGSHNVRYASHDFGSRPTTMNAPGHRSQMSWLSSYQQLNGMQNGSSYRNNMNYGPRLESDESYSSGSSASCTSSSYTDNSGRPIGIKQTPRVKFASPASASESKFDKVMKRVDSVLDKPLYRLNKVDEEEEDRKKLPMFYCPNCKTNQRDFINFATAAGIYDSPQGYLAGYFALYLMSSLFVFGLEEGWAPLDCVYFSVITLTTAGLGDFVPSTDGGKILCACFIYVGVATIGLLLGSLLAGSMDNAHKKEAHEAQIRDCPNCLRLEKAKRRSMLLLSNKMANRYEEMEQNRSCTPSDGGSEYADIENIGLDLFEPSSEEPSNKVPYISAAQRQAQIHTRHMSIDIGGRLFAGAKPSLRRSGSGVSLDGLPAIIDESTPFLGTSAAAPSGITPNSIRNSMEMRSMDDSYSSSSTGTESSSVNPSKPMTRVKAAKYIFLTLRQALVNSLFIITAGSFGFYYIEDMSAVDSFYFTTVLLTSVGYGDIVPVTSGGKVFATIFVVVAGTVLLHNMTLISMIPLELRKRRVEHAVLGQFGSQLNDDELRELSTGRLINRLKLATNRPDGLEECTREMFSLAMLVRLGRITENDVTATFNAFRRLDTGNYGKLNSRTIIEGELMRRKSLRNLAALSPPEEEWVQQPQPQPQPQQQQQQHTQNYSTEVGLPQGPYTSDFNLVHHGSPNPFMNPNAHPSNGSFIRQPSMDSYYSQGLLSRASSFNYDEYERWASIFSHYSSPNRGEY